MKKWFAPLGIFALGMIGIAFFLTTRQGIEDASGNLSANTSSIPGVAAGLYWGWDWLMTPGVVVFSVFIIALLYLAYYVGKKALEKR